MGGNDWVLFPLPDSDLEFYSLGVFCCCCLFFFLFSVSDTGPVALTDGFSLAAAL